MKRLLKLFFFLVLLAFLGLVGYAYLGDMSPSPVEVDEAIKLDLN